MSARVLRRPRIRWVVLLAVVAGLFAAAAPAQAWSGYGLQHGMSGKCLDADRNTWYSNGGKVQVWDCNGASNQRWWANWDATWSAIATPGGSAGPSKCLDAWTNGDYVWGYKVSVWDCNGGEQQGWGANSPYGRANQLFGLYLDVPNGWAPANGQVVGLLTRQNTNSQTWWLYN